MLRPKTVHFGIYESHTFFSTIYKIYGISRKTAIFLVHAVESLVYLFHGEFHGLTWQWLGKLLPNYQYVSQKKTYNLLVLLGIRTYRSFRMLFGYPSRGQRTWSNANTVRRLHPTLLLLKTKQLSRYTYHPYTTTETLCEYINFIWYLQWTVEWVSMRNNRLNHKFFRTQPNKFLRFDDIINFRIEQFAKEVLERKKFKSHRKKRKINRNNITGGFKFGFISYYARLGQ